MLADDRSALDMAIDETDEEAAAPTPPDTPGDKLNAILRVFREYVEAIAADTGEALGEIGLSAKTCA